MRITVSKRPILVWVMVLFFSVPALLYLVISALVLGGIISPPSSLVAHFTKANSVTLAINAGEALMMLGAMSALFAMSKVAFPLCVLYFAIDLIHNVSGKFVVEPNTGINLVVTAFVDVAAVGYVWYLKRKGQLH